jgi:hypothetical protein
MNDSGPPLSALGALLVRWRPLCWINWRVRPRPGGAEQLVNIRAAFIGEQATLAVRTFFKDNSSNRYGEVNNLTNLHLRTSRSSDVFARNTVGCPEEVSRNSANSGFGSKFTAVVDDQNRFEHANFKSASSKLLRLEF